MACLEMYNNSDHKGASPPPPMSSRISFSNDFAESHSQINTRSSTTSLRSDAPISSDFEFSVSNNSKLHQLSAADELFFKGRILPMKENPKKSHSKPPTTLRDELLAGDDDDEDVYDDGNVFALKPPQSKGRWKGFLGLRKSHIGPKKTTDFFSFPLQDQPSTPQGILEEESNDDATGMEMKM